MTDSTPSNSSENQAPHSDQADSAQTDSSSANASSPKLSPTNPAPRCPTCANTITPETKTFPFCSTRCRQADLAQWLKGDYMISRPLEQADFNED